MKIVNDKKILGNKINGRISNVIGWITVAIMGSPVVIMYVACGK
jgi:Mn2+/Fe2+ NRAMP family transporter